LILGIALMRRKTANLKAPKAAPATLHQVAALPVRTRDGQIEVCLITTRGTRRWTLPKGWPMKGRQDSAAARIEAEQEAGVTGTPGEKPVGSFLYWKRRVRHFDLVEVTVYPLRETESLPVWKEQAQRIVCWANLRDAATVVDEPGLAALLLEIDSGELKI
jgi:8-oxo-dGTP pyrophosphatase MutT (NUDIX family)